MFPKYCGREHTGQNSADGSMVISSKDVGLTMGVIRVVKYSALVNEGQRDAHYKQFGFSASSLSLDLSKQIVHRLHLLQ